MRRSSETFAALLWRGFAAGGVGFVTIAACFVGLDLAAGRSVLYTPALFGSVLLYGLRSGATLRITLLPVVVYTALHLLALGFLGFVAAWARALADRQPRFWYVGIGLFLGAFLPMQAAATHLLAPVQTWLPGGMILLSSAMAAILMGVYVTFREGPATLPRTPRQRHVA